MADPGRLEVEMVKWMEQLQCSWSGAIVATAVAELNSKFTKLTQYILCSSRHVAIFFSPKLTQSLIVIYCN